MEISPSGVEAERERGSVNERPAQRDPIPTLAPGAPRFLSSFSPQETNARTTQMTREREREREVGARRKKHSPDSIIGREGEIHAIKCEHTRTSTQGGPLGRHQHLPFRAQATSFTFAPRPPPHYPGPRCCSSLYMDGDAARSSSCDHARRRYTVAERRWECGSGRCGKQKKKKKGQLPICREENVRCGDESALLSLPMSKGISRVPTEDE